MKEIIKIFAIAGAVFLSGYLFLFPPFPLTPPIGRNLSSEIQVAERQFAERVYKAFPAGTSDVDMRKNLAKQGFRIELKKDGKWHADFEKRVFACNVNLSVAWQSDDADKIKNLEPVYGVTCL